MKNKRKAALAAGTGLILTLTIGGTLAYLTDTTEQVKNTFVIGHIGELTLTETDNGRDGDQNSNTNEYLIVPGQNITKDPTVAFTYDPEKENVDAYVFVRVEAADWTMEETTAPGGSTAYVYRSNAMEGTDAGSSADDLAEGAMEWTMADGWQKVDGTPAGDGDVYYREAAAGTGLAPSAVMKPLDQSEATIQVKGDEITKENIGLLADAMEIRFTAYAIQKPGFEDDVLGAWNKVR